MIDDVTVDNVKTTLTGKMSFSIDLDEAGREVILKKLA